METKLVRRFLKRPIIDQTTQPLTFMSLEDNNQIYWAKTSTAYTRTISVSLNGGRTWTNYTSTTGTRSTDPEPGYNRGTLIGTLQLGQKMLIKGTNSSYAYKEDGTHPNWFYTTKKLNIQGNIMSLFYGDNFIGQTELPNSSRQLYSIFGHTKVVNANRLILPATTLRGRLCYGEMFENCSELVTPPALPATTLSLECYWRMFTNCLKLRKTPALPAISLTDYCYYAMFNQCANIDASELVLNAPILKESCYERMFSQCFHLITAPQINALQNNKNSCKEMFWQCALVNVQASLLGSLAEGCYYGMFNECTSLQDAPMLPESTLVKDCYREMFYACWNLQNIACLATDISADNCTKDWVAHVTPTPGGGANIGTFTKSVSMNSWTIGDNGIPNEWTVLSA